MGKHKKIKRIGFEAIWRPEPKLLDIYELEDGVPYLSNSYSFKGLREAESWFHGAEAKDLQFKKGNLLADVPIGG